MTLRNIAIIISRIFDFYFWFPVLLFVTIFNSGLGLQQIKLLLPILLAIDVILPISLFFLTLKKGGVSDIDVTKRQERHKLFGTLIFIISASCVVSYLFGNNLFFVLQLIALTSALTMFLITLRFKISGHALTNAGSIFVINYLFDFNLLWLFVIVPIVAFARIYLKKHTFVEVFAGGILGLAEPYLILKFFKLI